MFVETQLLVDPILNHFQLMLSNLRSAIKQSH